MDGESWMPREAGWTRLGLNFRDPLTCAPGGSAPPLEELRALYEHLQARILEMIEPSSLKLLRAKDASSTACGETPQLRDIHRSAGRIATIFTSQTACSTHQTTAWRPRMATCQSLPSAPRVVKSPSFVTSVASASSHKIKRCRVGAFSVARWSRHGCRSQTW
jgi:hypothetical protein